MGGEIGVESEVGVGSTFAFTVRLGIGSDSMERAFRTIPDLRGMRALVVDDNPTAREILRTYLEAFTFSVDEAPDGDDAVELIKQADEPYDLMILDWLMPTIKGPELAARIKSELKPAKDPHLIMVSAFGSEELRDKPGGEFIDCFLSKPVSPSDLFDAVMGAFGVAVEPRKRGAAHPGGDDGQLRPIQGSRILLVEDNELNQQVASELLEHARFNVEIANHGQEAIERLEKERFDCVLMDVQMPVMDGLTATALLREDPRFQNLPILAMTANATVEDQQRCLQAGMNDHIAKPIRPQLLFEALLKWIEHGERDLPDVVDAATDGPEESHLDEVEGVDVEEGLSRIGGNQAAYRRLLAKFVDNQASAIDDLRSALDEGDRERAIRVAHTLKGVSGAVGATGLQELAASMESQLTEPGAAAPQSEISRLEAELTRVLAGIRGALEIGDRALPRGPALPSDIVERLKGLLGVLEEYDAAAEDILSEILEEIGGSSLRAELAGVQRHLGQYDFEGAAELLSPLIDELERQQAGVGGAETEGGDTVETGPLVAPMELAEQLRGLLETIEDYDSASDDLLLHILNQVEGSDLHAKLTELRKPLDQYDFEAAADLLRPLIEPPDRTDPETDS
jgi:CheY-like chemotaxis protein